MAIPDPGEPLLLSQYGERYTRCALYQVIVRLGRRAGITSIKINPHSIRYLGNPVARGQGVDQETPAKLLNHVAPMRGRFSSMTT